MLSLDGTISATLSDVIRDGDAADHVLTAGD
jgi:hypothetical protein